MKKFTVCLLIGAMAASMLTGCGSNGGSSDSSDSKADSSSETMTIMMNGSDSDAYMEGYRKIIDGFNESNEYGVKVEIQNVTNSDYKTKLTTMMASDSEPDIIFTWPLGYLENFVNGDKIVSLQKYLDEDEEWKNSFNGGILDPLTYDGEVYAIPTQQSTAIMYYNKAIFDKYGLEVPTTYDEYVQVCDTLKENGVTPVALASTADDAWLVSQYIQQLSDGIKGEDLFNTDYWFHTFSIIRFFNVFLFEQSHTIAFFLLCHICTAFTVLIHRNDYIHQTILAHYVPAYSPYYHNASCCQRIQDGPHLLCDHYYRSDSCLPKKTENYVRFYYH